MAKFNVEAGRQYLASLPEFRPTKPLSEYKPATIKRYVNQFQAQQRAGVPLSRQAARGHVVTPEHGPRGARPRLPASAREYRGGKLPKSKYLKKTIPLPRPHVHRVPINVPERIVLSDKSVVDNFTSTSAALHHLRANMIGTDRAVVSGFDCEFGVYRSIGINRGHNPGWVIRDMLEKWAQSGMDFEDWFIAIANSTDSDPEQSRQDMQRVCRWTIHIYPVDTHLRASAFARAR